MTNSRAIDLEKIAGYFKSAQGIITSLIGCGVIAGSLVLNHDTRLKKRFIQESTKVNQDVRIDNWIKTDSLNHLEYKGLITAIIANQNHVSDSIEMIYTNQSKLTNSITLLALKVSETPLEFARIMEGKTFELIQSDVMKSVFPETKIKIIKSDTTIKK